MRLITSLDELNPVINRMRALKKPLTLGFTGVPPEPILREAIAVSSKVVDLDMPAGHDISVAETIIPKISCATLRTIASNALLYKDLDWIILSAGYDKCDGGRFLGMQLQKVLSIPVLLTENRSLERRGNPICESGLPLLEKMERIVNGLISDTLSGDIKKTDPAFGFWGVPPNDFSVLELFPDNTHIFGWARCMENRTPSDTELEELVDPAIPTIFFAQAFCPKNILAYRLASQYNGLYVEVDSRVDHSIKAKIEAFLWIHGKKL